MSYILEALKKSEQERRRSQAPSQAPPVQGRAAPVRSNSKLIATIVSLNLAVVAWLLWPQPSQKIAETAPPQAELPQQNEPPLASLVDRGVKPEPEPPTPAPTKPANAEARPSTEAVTPPTQNEVKEQVKEAAETSAPRPAKKEVEDTARLTEFAALPITLRRRIPEITVNVHVYSDRPKARFVLIDLRRYEEGSQLPNGLYLERIAPDGLVFEFDGERFLFPVR